MNETETAIAETSDDVSTRSAHGDLVLRHRADGHLELRANGIFVMDTRETSTEKALATRALDLHADPRHVLIGGLGLGFTLEAVLSDGRVETVTVVEIEPLLVEWMRAGRVPHGPALMSDERVRIEVADVAVVLRESQGAAYDLVLLDVDNGPGYLVHDANGALYEAPALADARRATAPGGTVVVWSAAQAPALLEVMGQVFDETEALSYPVDLQGHSETYWLYAGTVSRRNGTN
ncbi:spermine/spermidine synthase [Nocardioides albertanoniae]|uniref:Spermine/spermidine synthase n=1 Tax=Nocardioides albertanoniae TaxID=1175486 RepID=A0A543AB55_9ACTN|nr:spermine/spermidine synthase [Nocardioides albertanoniae]